MIPTPKLCACVCCHAIAERITRLCIRCQRAGCVKVAGTWECKVVKP